MTSMPPKSRPLLPVSATSSPVTALGDFGRGSRPRRRPTVAGVIEQLESSSWRSLRRTYSAPRQEEAVMIRTGQADRARGYRGRRAGGSPAPSCARRWSGSTLAPAGPTSGSSSKICSRPTPTRSAARPMRSRRLSDAERARGVWTISAGNAGQGGRLCRARGRHSLHGGGDRDRAADQARTDGGARRDDRAGALWRVAGRRGACLRGHGRAPSSIRSTITISSPATARWASRSSRTRPTCATVIAAIGGGGLITGVGSAIKALRPDVTVLGAEPETAAPYALSLREGAAAANSPTGRRRSSMAPAGRASPSACGSGCSRWSTARSS